MKGYFGEETIKYICMYVDPGQGTGEFGLINVPTVLCHASILKGFSKTFGKRPKFEAFCYKLLDLPLL